MLLCFKNYKAHPVEGKVISTLKMKRIMLKQNQKHPHQQSLHHCSQENILY